MHIIGAQSEFKDIIGAARAEYLITAYVFVLIKSSFTKVKRKLTYY